MGGGALLRDLDAATQEYGFAVPSYDPDNVFHRNANVLPAG